ncbi:MAG TPA: hypothetical protein VGW38_22200 [Chloroflexota bacterium]|nr:hypothetical protein [Chloroflexota bacterium]
MSTEPAERGTAPTIRELRELSEDDLITRHDELARPDVGGVRVFSGYYLDELARRHQNRLMEETRDLTRQTRGLTRQMRDMTAGIKAMTRLILGLTVINVVAVAGPPLAAWVATWWP